MTSSKLSFVTLSALFVLPVFAANPLLRQDPKTSQRYFLSADAATSKDRLVLGWTVLGENASTQYDFEKIASGDEAYLEQIGSKIADEATNVLVDIKTGAVVDYLYSLKDERGACVWFNEKGCGKLDFRVALSKDAKTATLMSVTDWSTNYVSVYALRDSAAGLSVRAKSNDLLPILNNDLTIAFDRDDAFNDAYRRDRERISSTVKSLAVSSLTSANGNSVIRIQAKMTVTVPKGNDSTFNGSETLEYVSSVKAGYETLAIKAVQ